jgi:hypothetical protein
LVASAFCAFAFAAFCFAGLSSDESLQADGAKSKSAEST